jgi:hypothetical protein
MEQVRNRSVQPQTRITLAEVAWDELNEPGAYLERGSGDLYRVPKEASPAALPSFTRRAPGRRAWCTSAGTRL